MTSGAGLVLSLAIELTDTMMPFEIARSALRNFWHFDLMLFSQRSRLSRVAQSSCRVGRKRISLMSMSSGWLIANATMFAKEAAGMANFS
jgi:hypothetical protein